VYPPVAVSAFWLGLTPPPQSFSCCPTGQGDSGFGVHTPAVPGSTRHRDSLKLVMPLPAVGESFPGHGAGEPLGASGLASDLDRLPSTSPAVHPVPTPLSAPSQHSAGASPPKSSRLSVRRLQVPDGRMSPPHGAGAGAAANGGAAGGAGSGAGNVTVESGLARSPTARSSTATGDLSFPGHRVHSFVASLPLIDGVAALSEGLGGGHTDPASKVTPAAPLSITRNSGAGAGVSDP
jgi:hypothetical protein